MLMVDDGSRTEIRMIKETHGIVPGEFFLHVCVGGLFFDYVHYASISISYVKMY